MSEDKNELQVFESKALEMMRSIHTLELQKQAIIDQEAGMRDWLQEQMEKYDIDMLENDKIKVSYIKATVRKSIDTAKLKKDLPELAVKYEKTSDIKANIRIAVKK